MGINRLKFTSLCLFILFAGEIRAQQNEYEMAFENGKQLFQLGRFSLAMEAFKPAMQESPENSYAPYASFYYAVSAYNSGYKPLARDMFLQINEKYPGWTYHDECTYWVSVIYFESGDLKEGMEYAYRVQDDSFNENVNSLKYVHINREDSIELLIDLYHEYPNDEVLARAIVDKMDKLPLEEKDFDLLQEISMKNGWEVQGIPVSMESIKKDSYNIAVLFPLIYQNMEASGYYLRRTAVIDLYEGIRQGVEFLNSNGLNIDLYVYDTKGDSTATMEILDKPELQQMDLIIGPLLPVPSKLANEFSYKNQINILNPVSSNSLVLGNNPYAFLLHPSTITLGKKAGEFSVSNMGKKNTVIFYGESESDYQMAEAFKQVVEQDSFPVLANRKIHKDSAEYVYELLTMKQDVLDSLGTVVIDSLTELPVEEYVIPPDSIGLIFLATFDFKIASEVISAVAERGDSTQIIGHGRWLSDKTANYPYMEKLGIWLLTPEYVDYTRTGYEVFSSDYLEKYHILPSDYVLMGYESALFSGYCLHQFGVYFQNELHNKVIKNISLFEGYDYRGSQDNQYIPILKFENLDLVIQNIDKNQY